MNRTYRLFAVLCGLCVLVSGCGKKEGGGASATTAQSSTPGDAESSAGKTASASVPANGRAVEITANDQMKFSVNEIKAKPGEAISVTLKNVGTIPKFSMGHNFVLLKDAKLIEAFIQDAAMAAATNYIADAHKSEVIAHTKLLGPKEEDTVTFAAPTQPGRYPFLCSFPGHYQVGMKGELIVE